MLQNDTKNKNLSTRKAFAEYSHTFELSTGKFWKKIVWQLWMKTWYLRTEEKNPIEIFCEEVALQNKIESAPMKSVFLGERLTHF